MLKANEPDSAGADTLSALLEAVAAGCAVSFESFYAQTSRRIFGLVLRINSDRSEAEELLQEIYITVWQDRARYDRQQGSAMHWLASIARNRAIDSLRRRKVRPQKFDAVADEDDDFCDRFESTSPGPLECLIESRRAAAVLRCVEAFPDEQRESLMLAFYGGLSYSDIALHLGRPIGTVKGWIRRSLLSMRTTLVAESPLGFGARGEPAFTGR